VSLSDDFRAARLPREWYARDAVLVARGLIGCFLVHESSRADRLRVSRIVETEAYRGPRDLACHARAGLTKRTRALFGEEGRAYVFLIYGMHDCFNVTCRGAGHGHAVLVRAGEPTLGFRVPHARAKRESGRNEDGVPHARAKRESGRNEDGVPHARAKRESGRNEDELPEARLDGPGRFARAMGITRAFDGRDLTEPPLYLCARRTRPRIVVTARVGVGYAGPWAERPWRFFDANSKHVSKPPRSAIGAPR
jgi:DNA-3-methyladenine glycosylase